MPAMPVSGNSAHLVPGGVPCPHVIQAPVAHEGRVICHGSIQVQEPGSSRAGQQIRQGHSLRESLVGGG